MTERRPDLPQDRHQDPGPDDVEPRRERDEPHAITQARLRYGIELRPADLGTIADLCAKGTLLKRDCRAITGPTEWRQITFRGVVMVVGSRVAK